MIAIVAIFVASCIGMNQCTVSKQGRPNMITSIPRASDTTPPATVAHFVNSYNITNPYLKPFVTGSTSFTLIATDAESGVANTYFRVHDNTTGVECRAWQVYSSGFTLGLSTNGTYTIVFDSIDSDGNNETLQYLTVYIDAILPATLVHFTNSYNETGPSKYFVTGATAFTLIRSDNIGGSGIANTHFRVHDNTTGVECRAWQVYSSGFTLGLSTNGTYTIVYDSIDNANNNKSLEYQIVYINTTPPNTTISVSSAYSTNASTSTRLMPGQDFTRWHGFGGTITTDKYVTTSNYDALYCDVGTVPEGFIYQARAATSLHVLSASFEFEMLPGPVQGGMPAGLAEIHVTEMSGFVTCADGMQFINVAPQKPVNTFYDICVQIYNSNHTYRLWIDGKDTGMHDFGWNAQVPQADVHFVELTCNNGVTATFSNFAGKPYALASTIFRLNAADDTTVADTCIKVFYNDTGTEFVPWTSYPGPSCFYTLTNGTYTACYCSIDALGNNESLRHFVFYWDGNAPTTTASIVPASSNHVSNGSVITLSVIDGSGESGVNQTWYKCAGDVSVPWTRYTAPFTIPGLDGDTVTIAYCSWDNVGNNESLEYSATLTFDDITPVTTTHFTNSYNATTPYTKCFVTGSTSFTLIATDTGGVGVAATRYRITVNGVAGSWTNYTGAFTVGSSLNGTYMIAWNSTDKVGNVEGSHYLTVYIDTTAPVTAIVYSFTTTPYHVEFSTSFTLPVSDDSGINCTWYRYTGIDWMLYTGAFMLSNATAGDVVIEWYSTDMLGNNETLGSTTVILAPATPGSPAVDYTWYYVAVIAIVAAVMLISVQKRGGKNEHERSRKK